MYLFPEEGKGLASIFIYVTKKTTEKFGNKKSVYISEQV